MFFIILVINFSIATISERDSQVPKFSNSTHLNLQACTCKIDRQFVQFIIIIICIKFDDYGSTCIMPMRIIKYRYSTQYHRY